MKRVITFLSFIVLHFVISAQSIAFQKTYGSTVAAEDDYGRSVQQTNDGGYIIAGYSDSFGNGTDDCYLVKTNSIGDTTWTKIYGSINEDAASDIQQTLDGGYIVAGASDNISTYTNVVLFKTYSNGNLQWYKTYVGSNYEGGASVQQTLDGGFIIAGSILYAFSSPSVLKAYLMRTDSNGDTLWTKSYGTTNEIFSSVRQISDGSYIACGYSCDTVQCDVYLVKTDSNGDTLWTKTYGGTRSDKGYSVQQANDGGYIITGGTQSFDTTVQYGQVYLIKTDSSGDTIWTKTINNLNSLGAVGHSVKQTFDQGYIIGGTHGYIADGEYDVYLIKTNSNGDTLWTRTYGGSGHEEGWSVQQTTDMGYVITGLSNTNGFGFYYDVYLIKTDSLGNTGSFPVVGVQEQEQITAGEITIYPNPFTEQANLVLPDEIETDGEAELVIYDVPGNETARVKITAQRALIQRDNLKAGMYFCRVVKENAVVATGKFIIQ